jgi:hypothetical protein
MVGVQTVFYTLIIRSCIWFRTDLYDLQPSGKLLIDQFSLVTPGGYADTYKSKTSILCNDGLMRHVRV